MCSKKEWFFVRKTLFLFFVFYLFFTLTSSGGPIEVDGTLLVELTSDPYFYDPAGSSSEEDYSGIIYPGYAAAQFSKLTLGLRVSDYYVDAYLPLTFGVQQFRSNQNPMWQVFLEGEDFLNIPYHFSLKGSVFSYKLSSRPVGDLEYGFLSSDDPLGIFRRPNSLQPYYTFKIELNQMGAWNGVLYSMFDQKVDGMPQLVKIPAGPGTVGDAELQFDGEQKKVSELGFIDEIAQYNILQIEKPVNDGAFKIYLGTKSFDNPKFRMLSAQDENSKAVSLINWGYASQNFGIGFEQRITNSELTATLFKSQAQWYQYSTSQSGNDTPGFFRRWYPYTVKGELEGMAASLNLKIGATSNQLEMDFVYVEPEFQPIAATSAQFPVVEKLVLRDASSDLYSRRAQTIFDPNGKLLGQEPSSPVLDFLGKKVIKLTYHQNGNISQFPVNLKFGCTSVGSLGDLKTKYLDPLTGAKLTRDYKELFAILHHESREQKWSLTGLSRNYLGDKDHLQNANLKYSFPSLGFRVDGFIDGTDRLKNTSGQGSALRITNALNRKLTNNSNLSFAMDYRTGTYDYDLLSIYGDEVVTSYDYLGLSSYIEKTYLPVLKSGQRANIQIAGEVFARKTDLEGVESGTSLIGFLGLKLPLNNKITSNTALVGVTGPKEIDFASNHISTTLHQEIVISPNQDDTQLAIGITKRAETKSNVYAQLNSKLGIGTLSLAYGAASPFGTKYDCVNLPGTLTDANIYGFGNPAPASLEGRIWEKYSNESYYQLWQRQIRSLESSWVNHFNVKYWVSF